MVKNLPDKWIRKSIIAAINNMVVDGFKIPCYDLKVVGQSKDYYVIISTQSNEVDSSIKCGKRWESQVLLEVTTIFDKNGNKSGRLLADNILDKIRELTESLTLDSASGLKIETKTESFPNDLVSTNINTIVYRKFIRIELLIN